MGNMTSMVSSVLFPILNSKYTEKQKKEYEEMNMDILNIDSSDIITKSDCYDCACNTQGECEKDYKYNP